MRTPTSHHSSPQTAGDCWVLVEDVLRPVAVVDVEVYDSDLPDAMARLGDSRSNGHIVQQAKPSCAVIAGVVTWRADQSEAAPYLSAENSLSQSATLPTAERQLDSGSPGLLLR